MKLTYSELFELLLMARKAYKKDYQDYQMQSDIEALEKIEKMFDYINKSYSMEFTLDEMPK